MPAFLIPMLMQFGPYILGAVALVVAYFGIRNAGAKAANEKNAAAQEKVREEVNKKIDAAVSKDEAIDQKVQEKIDEVREKPISNTFDGDRFKF